MNQVFYKILYYFEQEHRQWLLWFPVGLGIGIGVYFSLENEPSYLIPCVLGAAFLGLALGVRSLSLKALSAFICIVLVGFLSAKIRTTYLGAPLLLETFVGSIEGEIESVEEMPKAFRMVLKNVKLGHGVTVYKKVRIRFQGRLIPLSLPLSGDRVRLYGRLMPPPLPAMPGGYNFRQKAYFSGISAVGFALGEMEVTSSYLSHQPPKLWERLNQVLAHQRFALSQQIKFDFPSHNGALINAFITGDRGAIPEKTRQQFADAGIAHILAISGLHFSIVAGLIFFFIRRCLSLWSRCAERYSTKKISAVLALCVTSMYLLLCGAPIPAQRAFFMTSLVLIGILFDRTAISLRNVAFAAILILLFSPESLLNVSFQLSFAAVIVLVAGYESIIRKGALTINTHFMALNFICKYVGGLILTTVLATLATTPFIIYTFHKMTIHAVAGNLVAIPLLSLILMPLSLAYVMGTYMGFSDVCIPLLEGTLNVLVSCAHRISEWPGASIPVRMVPQMAIISFVFGGLWLCLWQHKWRHLGWSGIGLAVVWAAVINPPDLLITADQKLIAFYNQDRHILSNTKQSGRFALESFMKIHGKKEVKKEIFLQNGEYKCIKSRQILRIKDKGGGKWIYFADQVLGPGHFEKNLAYVFWFEKNGIQVQHVRGSLGKRPWS